MINLSSIKELEDSEERKATILKLISLGSAIVPLICSTLDDQGRLERKLMRYFELESKSRMPTVSILGITKNPHNTIIYPITENEREELRSLWENIRKLAGGNSFYGETDEWCTPEKILFYERRRLIEGLLKILSEIKDKSALVTLEGLPEGVDYKKYNLLAISSNGRLFSKVKDAIEIIKTSKGAFEEEKTSNFVNDDPGDFDDDDYEQATPNYEDNNDYTVDYPDAPFDDE